MAPKFRPPKGKSPKGNRRDHPLGKDLKGKPEDQGSIKISRGYIFFCLLILIILPAWTFWPVLSHQFINWDDPINVIENPQIKAFTPEKLKEIISDSAKISKYYIPLTFLTFSLDHALFGLDAEAFHRTNLILHIANGLLVLWFFYLLTHRLSLAFAGAAIFSLHPIQVEAVSWVSERKGLLATFFLLGALLLYRRYLEKSSKSFYVGAIIFFFLSLLSKPSGLLLPFLLLLLDFFLGRRGDRRALYEKTPFFAMSFIFGFISVWGQQASGAMSSRPILSVDNLLAASYGVLFYLSKFFIPANFSAFYPYPDKLSIISLLLTLGLIGGVFYYRRQREIFFGLTFFFLTIFPALKLVPFGRDFIAADRLIYFSIIGLVFLAGWLFHHLAKGAPLIPPLRRIAFFLVVAGIIGTFAGLSRHRVQVWRDSETLWKDVLQRYPGVAVAYTNLGHFYSQKGMLEESISEYKKALAIDPTDALTYNNLGVVYRRKELLDEAISIFQKALDLNPQYALAHTNLGVVYEQKGLYDEAISAHRKALAIDSKLALARTNLGTAYMKKGMVDEAIEEHRQALALDPTNAMIQANLGSAYGEKNMLDQAIAQFQKALVLDPSYAKAHYNLAVAYLRKNEFLLATQHFERAMALGHKIPPEILKIIRGPQ